MQNLEGDDSVMLGVLSEIDCSHAAAAKLPVDDVRAGEGSPQTVDWKLQFVFEKSVRGEPTGDPTSVKRATFVLALKHLIG